MNIFDAIVIFVVPIVLVLLAYTVLVHIFFRIPYVPTRQRIVKKLIRVAQLKPHETVYDLGCGDGRLLIEARRKAKINAVGFEIAPLVYLLAWVTKLLARSPISLKFQNLFKTNLRQADVIFCYLLPEAMVKISRKIKKECRKGTRIISHTFQLPGFDPIKIIKKNRQTNMPTIYVYQR